MLIVAAPVADASAQHRRDRRGDNEIYLPDWEQKQFDCKNQCATFRQACLGFCKDEGHVPGSRELSDDCTKDCKQMESDCFDSCTRSMSFMKPPPPAVSR